MKTQIWAINKIWETIKTFNNVDEAEIWWDDPINQADRYQILYRNMNDEGEQYPIHVFKSVENGFNA